MLGPERQRLRQLRLPRLPALPRQCVDQVEADPREAALRRLERSQPLVHSMRPPQEAERIVPQRLQAQRDPVHPRRRKVRKPRRLY
jgi:hypothetical protein